MNKWLEGKEENLDEADKGETQAEAEHSANVCDEGGRRHNLEKKKVFLFINKNNNLICFEFWEVWWVKKCVDLDQIFRSIGH